VLRSAILSHIGHRFLSRKNMMLSFLTKSKSAQGFTLLEVLVVMSLMSILMLGMVSALRGVGQGGDRVDVRLQALDEKRIAVNFVRATLGRISARPVVNPKGAGPLFEGSSTAVAWVGVMPARYSLGGRFFFRLGAETVHGESALVLRYLPWADQPEFPDWSSASTQVIFHDVTDVAFRYEDPRQPDANARWGTAWPFVDDLPSRVSIAVNGQGGVSRLVVPLWRLPASDPRSGSGDGTVVGGT
jgi:general secretion pathway protein J